MKSFMMLLLSAGFCLAGILVINTAPVSAASYRLHENVLEKGQIWQPALNGETVIRQASQTALDLPKQLLAKTEVPGDPKAEKWGNSKGRQGCISISWGTSSCGSGCKTGFGASTCDVQPK
jgi:hypothetical protein